jgi:hypothetical protein
MTCLRILSVNISFTVPPKRICYVMYICVHVYLSCTQFTAWHKTRKAVDDDEVGCGGVGGWVN